MAANASTVSKAAATWPPIVYIILGCVALLFWGAGTAIQVQTSEAWIMGASVKMYPSISTFTQIWDFVNGKLPPDQLVPFTFAWGVQLALIIASAGIEMPKYPQWRYYLAWAAVIVLIGINSCGDYVYSAGYGFWGQLGFTVVILFVTFCMGLVAVICFMHAWSKMNQHS